MTSSVAFSFRGELDVERFAAFAHHRADRLSVAATVVARNSSRIDIEVAGEPELIDMFEMACSLGPIDCLIRSVERRDRPPS